MVNGWKITAIVFIVLFLLSISFYIYSAKKGMDIINNENNCAIRCENNEFFYSFDYINNMCYCLNSDSEIELQFLVG